MQRAHLCELNGSKQRQSLALTGSRVSVAAITDKQQATALTVHTV
jgi:hypothetical protein